MSKQLKLNLKEITINSDESNSSILRKTDLCIDLDSCENVYITLNGCKYKCDKNKIMNLLNSCELVEVQ